MPMTPLQPPQPQPFSPPPSSPPSPSPPLPPPPRRLLPPIAALDAASLPWHCSVHVFAAAARTAADAASPAEPPPVAATAADAVDPAADAVVAVVAAAYNERGAAQRVWQGAGRARVGGARVHKYPFLFRLRHNDSVVCVQSCYLGHCGSLEP